ncbi:hypothetical protein [Hydrogenimonas sp.]
MFKQFFSIFVALTISLGFLSGCGGASTTGASFSPGDDGSPIVPASTTLDLMDDDSFNALSDDDKLYIAKKLYSTIYKGKDYTALKGEIDSGKFISSFASKLSANVQQPDLTKEETYIPFDPSLEAHDYQQDRTERYAGNIKQEIYTRLFYTKMSQKYFNEWTAYVLTQTILFSPAREVDSVTPFPEFIRNVYYRLVKGLDEGKTVKKIVYEHMISTENWGRFRSPEDNGREMLEIWLRNFQDEPVPVAAKALQNWKFDNYYKPSEGWVVYDFYHDEPGVDLNESVELFGVTLKNGYDFFKMVTEHPNFMPTVVARIVDYFFPTLSEAERTSIVELILEEKPETFQEIFAQILFSKKYLLESDKVKSIEETYYSLVQSLPYHMTKSCWSWSWAPSIKGISAAMDLTNQKSMWNKLGRDNSLPVDTLSINYYHQFIRSGVLLAQCDNPDSEYQEGIVPKWFDERLDKNSIEAYIDGIFLEVLGRHANETEKTTLTSLVKKAGWDEKFGDWIWQRTKTLKLTLDYISRLSEVYRYQRIEGGAQ